MTATAVRTVYIILLLFSFSKPYAQKSVAFHDKSAGYYQGLELYQQERYASAFGVLDKWLQTHSHQTPEYPDALYYRAAAAYRLENTDAYALLLEFLNRYPTHLFCHKARFMAGNLQFKNGRFQDAINHLELAINGQLSENEQREARFKAGYAYMQTKKTEKALSHFDALIEKEGFFTADALYYRGHIYFEKGRLEAALRDLKKVENQPPYSKIAPYYIAQIYFRRKEYDKAGSYARMVADTAKGKSLVEMLKIWAESDFRTHQYNRAAEAYERLEREKAEIDRPMTYRIGITFLKASRFDEAAKKLGEVASGQDSLAQNAAYHLAEALMLTGRKKEALQAFKTAWKLNYDKSLAEDALFNFAKLAYELDFDPYHEAIRALQGYLEAYPNSPRNDELYTFLSEIYMGTRNYQEALNALQKIKNKTRKIREAYQRTAYLKAVELFNAGSYNEAIRYFNLSATYPESSRLMAESVFWTGEAFYRLGKSKEATEAFEEFRLMPGTRGTELYSLATYNLAYIHFRQARYKEASILFRQFLEAEIENPGRRYTDALLRTADCYYALRNYDQALKYYDQALSAKDKYDEDYALLQKALVLGIMNKPREKLTVLDALIQNHPTSVYLAEAIYDNANTRLRLGDASAAEPLFEKLILDFPQSRLRPKALLKLGLIAYNRNENSHALNYYKNVLESFPGTAEANEALRYVRNIYVEEGKMDEFNAFLGKVKGVSLSEGALDSATYQSAENRMLKGDCTGAIEGFTQYLARYPRGIFSLNARYFRGECLQKTGRSAEALEDMEVVANAASNVFSENALLAAASLALAEKNCLRAAPFLEKLEKMAELKDNKYYAQRNLMLCSYLAGDYSRAAEFGNKVLENEKVPQTDEEIAWMAAGYAAQLKGDTAGSEKFFMRVVQRPASYYAPEAKYNVCRILYVKKQYNFCEKKILEWANSVSTQRKWLAKMYILLGQSYAAQGNLFQAKATLQSIIDNHDDPEEINEARRILKEIESIESSEKLSSSENEE